MAALCRDDEWGRTWADVLQHRFRSDGELHDHAVGNLLIVALWELLGEAVDGLDWVARLLGAQGRVLPMSAVPLDITARVLGLDPAHPEAITEIRGQAEVATTEGHVVDVALDPADPPACPEALVAIAEADWVVVGPGSWFTSVIPNLLVPALCRGLEQTSARRLLTLNLGEQKGETDGFSPETHLEVLAAHAPICASTWSSPTKATCPTPTRSAVRRSPSGPSWSSPTSPTTTSTCGTLPTNSPSSTGRLLV